MYKKFVKEYLTFSKNDRIFIIVMICLFGIILLIPRLPFFASKFHQPDSQSVAQAIDSMKGQTAAQRNTVYPSANYTEARDKATASVAPSLFYFDPNHISQAEWAMLGVNQRTSASIKKYLQKGGSFKKPDDLFKIYLLDKNLAKQLVPYVRFKDVQVKQPIQSPAVEYTSAVKGTGRSSASFPAKQYRTVQINTADTSEFQTFPGIGSALSNRIVKYRESLGGFISTSQIGEVYNLPDSVFQKIRAYLELDPAPIKKININTIVKDQLPLHPYLSFGLMNSIIQYRDQHGRFARVEDLHKLHQMDDNLFNKIAPYLTIE